MLDFLFLCGLVKGLGLKRLWLSIERVALSVSAVPVGPGMEDWQTCWLLGSMLRARVGLSCRVGRFMPCVMVAHIVGFRTSGVTKEVVDPPSRPRETAAERFFDELLRLFGYADKSAAGLLDGTLKFRYCTAAFARMLPT